MSSLPGKYIFESGENIDEYLSALGVGAVPRKVYSVTKPDLEITLDKENQLWTIAVETVFHKYELKFKLDETVEKDETFDIRKCKTVVSKHKDHDDQLLMVQTPTQGSQVQTTIKKLADGGVSFELECDGNTAKQVFKPKTTAAGDTGNNNLHLEAESGFEAVLQE